MVDLLDLGWDADWEKAFGPHRADGLIPGRVATEDRQAFAVVTELGELPARIAGRMIQAIDSTEAWPKVGDWVAVAAKPVPSRSVLHHVLPRRTTLIRKAAGRETAPQVLATNVDTAFIVQALDQTFNARRLERFLVMVHEGGSQAVVVLNKADLADDLEARVAEARVSAGAVPVVTVSARTRRGLGELRAFLRQGRTCVFVGTSGVGKSSLINRLYGEAVQATLDVREEDGKGRHTTTWRELILLPGGGLVIDTPGMREFHLWMADGGLSEAFPDVAELALKCHFRACSHLKEERCAVRAAVTSGRLSPERFEAFRKLRGELDYLAQERREHTYAQRRRQARGRRRSAMEATLDSGGWGDRTRGPSTG
ncbi:MAG: ribosome small subunit-dependent GTPase A [Verrucomicrobiales bacterium]|nr:ribosome small subunit-dependent GTPase A [Verrucomicrobiales bacterium]